MNKEQFLQLSDLDKVKYTIEESLKEHKKYNTEYWKGSAFMGESILQAIEQVKNLTIPVVVGQSEQLVCPNCKSPHITDRIFKKECLMCGQKVKAN